VTYLITLEAAFFLALLLSPPVTLALRAFVALSGLIRSWIRGFPLPRATGSLRLVLLLSLPFV
jgi:hypothetical protein